VMKKCCEILYRVQPAPFLYGSGCGLQIKYKYSTKSHHILYKLANRSKSINNYPKQAIKISVSSDLLKDLMGHFHKTCEFFFILLFDCAVIFHKCGASFIKILFRFLNTSIVKRCMN
jgi:hypothetical protein